MTAARPLALIVTSTLPRWANDAEPRFILDLCQALAPRYRVLVLAPHCRGAATVERWGAVEVRRFRYAPEWAELLAYEGGILPKLRQRAWLWFLAPVFLLAQVAALVRILRTESVALVHAHWLVPQGVTARLALALARRRVPLVCTAHGADVFGLRGVVARALQRWVARGCARVGVVSAALGEELVRRGVPKEKLAWLPMGVAAPPLPDAPRDPNLIAFAGRLVEKKGVDVLLEAFAPLARLRPDATLCIAGGGPEEAGLRARAAVLGIAPRVRFLGAVPRERVHALFAGAAVAVMPSTTARDGDAEGLGLVMLEAMAAGCPVVVTDLPVVRDVARPGETALVFPERDATALASALAQSLSDPAGASRRAEAARRLVAAQFSWRTTAERHERVYGEVLHDNGILAADGGSSTP